MHRNIDRAYEGRYILCHYFNIANRRDNTIKIKVTVWNEFRHEKIEGIVKELYPQGIHTTIKNYLDKYDDFQVRTAVLDEPEHGLTDEVLDNTDVLIWWGHKVHDEVKDEIVKKVHERVLKGMGLIVLHSGHYSKIFKKLMGTTCSLRFRNANEREILWTVQPGHPIAEDIPDYIEIEHEEMYGEVFDIPAPDELIFMGWFQGGEVFRSGCCYYRGNGKIFYFQPGHEKCATYHNEEILKVISNSVRWARPVRIRESLGCFKIKEPLQKLD